MSGSTVQWTCAQKFSQNAPDVAPEKTRNQAKDFCRPYPILHMQLSFLPDSISLVLFQLVCRPCSNQLKAGPEQPLTEHIHHLMNIWARSMETSWRPSTAYICCTSLRISTSYNPFSFFVTKYIRKVQLLATEKAFWVRHRSWAKWNLKIWQFNSGGWPASLHPHLQQ